MSTEYQWHWHWAWRWTNTKEPAFIGRSAVPAYRSNVLRMIYVNTDIITAMQEDYLVHAHINLAQWDMWYEFKLCPVINIYDWSKDTFVCKLEDRHGH